MSRRALPVVALVLIFGLMPFVFAGATAGAAPTGPVVSLSMERATYAASQSVVVHATITNRAERPIRILRWLAPSGDIEEPLFTVTRDGQPVAYVGAVYKRPAPQSDDFVTLALGASMTGAVDLAQYYDLSVSGNYVIRYDVPQAQLASDPVAVWIEGRPALSPGALPAAEGVTGSTVFNKCTATQQSQLLTARANASSYAADAFGYLGGSNMGPRYTTWFGSYSASRHATVTDHFQAISNAMDNAPVNFDCGCKKRYYAYVYPNRPYYIYLCRVYWSAPATGTDSQAGTLIHEMSHFDVVAGTEDYVYGQSGAMNLAATSPDQAINNADNHEYFAENTPYKP